jgi:hypothetical protein
VDEHLHKGGHFFSPAPRAHSPALSTNASSPRCICSGDTGVLRALWYRLSFVQQPGEKYAWTATLPSGPCVLVTVKVSVTGA